jgi:hypothetical protein
MSKKGWLVEVEYEHAGVDLKIDGDLENEAKKRKGRHGGSGYYFPSSTRDISFIFKDEKGALNFRAWVARYTKGDKRFKHEARKYED